MAYFARGLFMANTEKNHAAAIADFGRTIAANPRYVEAYLQRGQLYQIDKQYDLAFATYDAGVKANPENSRVWAKRGETRLQMQPAGQDFDGAVADFEQAVRISPDDSMLKLQLQQIQGLRELARATAAEKK
jgi:tetratricopeptide (TPR) repeat protein